MENKQLHLICCQPTSLVKFDTVWNIIYFVTGNEFSMSPTLTLTHTQKCRMRWDIFSIDLIKLFVYDMTTSSTYNLKQHDKIFNG